jgi:hypothetical protein
LNKLFCTFSSFHNIQSVLNQITHNFLPSKVFILENKTVPEYIITYPFSHKENTIPQTVLVHRKTEYNVLFTINALNSIIINEIGYLDPSHLIKWENYKNNLITYNDNQLVFNQTKLYKVLNF